ncbi:MULTISPECIES: tetratricopeptide repeat protein [Nitrincola]|uniref:Type IV pilus biogenesis/stability protein PilW n=1 Tax=Nitrincola nitratireducens TaxID=1229521 RepID=W9UZL4_9GAMM|nr:MULTISPECIES: tetratricopeptide repeat protein [Nitrincola]EXJ09307.1 type IV pilus biogenesis/stability protein PilW [Nitrincola nitratireducens]
MKHTKWILISGSLLLAGCATSNPFTNIPVEDRTGRPVQSTPPAPVATPPSGVIVTPVDPGLGVTLPGEIPVVRMQRDLPPADEVWQPVTPQQSAPAPSVPSSSAPSVPENTAVVALLEAARSDTNSGDLRGAQSRLERALRISPREPDVYYELAEVKRQFGQFLDAEQVALRGVGVAEGQPAQLRKLWILISQIRTEAGDLAGAEEARERASKF